MKIACVSYLHGSGGAERQIIMLSNAMAEYHHEVYLIVLAEFNNRYEIADGVKVIDLAGAEFRKGNRILNRFSALRRALREIRPDASVHFWFQSAYLAAFMPRKLRGKLVYSERGDPGDKEYSGMLGLIRRIALLRVDGFVFQSNGAANYFKQSIQRRSVVIPNPVFCKKEDYPEVLERRKAIVTVGRLHPQKNQRLLIEAFAIISESFPEYILEIYGDGELENELRLQAKNLGISHRVLFKGTDKRVHARIYDAALFVLTSDFEGMPNALLEAMALGLPCISTDFRPGVAQEIINDGFDGLIVPIDNTDSLEKAISTLLNDKAIADVFGQRAAEKAKEFQADVTYRRWSNFFKKVYNE